jgi:ribosomal protein S18 acetylase RimI-like enzyme
VKISVDKFLVKYRQLFLDRTPGIEIFSYWKTKYLIENGETFYLPEYECYYMIRDNHLLIYYSPDNKLHLSVEELNSLNCISLPANMYDPIKEHLRDFNASYYWNLRYDYNYQNMNYPLQCETVDFEFSNQQHFIKAAEIINGGDGDFTDKNVKKMTLYSAFDPSLWFFVKDKYTNDLVAISISAYDREVKQTDLDWISVLPKYQGKGCGRYLVNETINRCKYKSDSICVAGTVEFYRKCGFVDYELWVWAPKKEYQFKAKGIQP